MFDVLKIVKSCKPAFRLPANFVFLLDRGGGQCFEIPKWNIKRKIGFLVKERAERCGRA
jgi:hypothetical protein